MTVKTSVLCRIKCKAVVIDTSSLTIGYTEILFSESYILRLQVYYKSLPKILDLDGSLDK